MAARLCIQHPARPALALALAVIAVLAGTAAGVVSPRHISPRAPSAFVSRRPAASADVSMNILDRFGRLVKANVNSLIANAEDPEKVLEQAVVDMQKDLVKIRQSYAEVVASQKRAKEQMRAAEDEAGKWYKRAQLALEKGEEDLAREALERRRGQDELAQSLASQLSNQDASVQGLYDAMKELEAKISEAKLKKDQYTARARTAKATAKVNDMLSDVGTSSAVAAFDRMKDKVETLEAEAETTRQLKLTSGSSAPKTMEDKFKVGNAGNAGTSRGDAGGVLARAPARARGGPPCVWNGLRVPSGGRAAGRRAAARACAACRAPSYASRAPHPQPAERRVLGPVCTRHARQYAHCFAHRTLPCAPGVCPTPPPATARRGAIARARARRAGARGRYRH